MINYNRITPEIFIGSFPKTVVDVERLRHGTGITAVLNMQTDQDFLEWGVEWDKLKGIYMRLEMAVERVPIIDFDPIDLRERLWHAAATLDSLIAIGHRVYVHCTAGIGRAPATVIAYLVWSKHWSLEKAQTYVKACRPCAPSIDAIRLAVADREMRQQQAV